jgi:hypothetical protein
MKSIGRGHTIIRSSSFAPGDLGPRRSSCSLLLNFPAFGLLELTPFFDAYRISILITVYLHAGRERKRQIEGRGSEQGTKE